jgi:hypothetical protein
LRSDEDFCDSFLDSSDDVSNIRIVNLGLFVSMRRKKNKKLCQIFSRDLPTFTVREVGLSCICCKENRETQCWCHYIGELQTTNCEICKKNEQYFSIYLTTNG